MKNRKHLRPISPEEMHNLQSRADTLARMQDFLNRTLPGWRVEDMSTDELGRLSILMHDPDQMLSGDVFLKWRNTDRRHRNLNR